MIYLLLIFTALFSDVYGTGKKSVAVHLYENPIPPRLQWNANKGYCGEVALISAGLYYGQYVSQYVVREASLGGQEQTQGQTLLGENALLAAQAMHLNAVEWKSDKGSKACLTWIKEQVLKGFPVALGVYANQWLFYQDPHEEAGDPEYDHIVCVFAIASNYPSTSAYYPDDLIIFSDHGLWTDPNPSYIFRYRFDSFLTDRMQANAPDGAIYSLSEQPQNYALTITGVADPRGETLPVRLTTSVNFESPSIADMSNIRPDPMPILLSITVSNLKPGRQYTLYKYDSLEAVPEYDFHKKASQACRSWPITISSGNSYTFTEVIQSDEVAIYRAVRG